MSKKPVQALAESRAARLAEDTELRLEHAILQAKQEWECTFDSVPDCILILDGELRARRLNLSLGARLGSHPRELLGKDLTDLTGEAADQLRHMAAEDASTTREMRIPLWGGHFLVTVSPFLDIQGARNGSIVVAHDISRWKQLEQQLEQSRKLEALGTLAGGIAHDFNNILGVIMGYAELMQPETSGGPQEHRIGEILRAGARAKDLISQILTFSRQGVARTMPLRLTPLVKEVLRQLEETMPGGITVRRRLSAGADQVLADPSMIHQVVMNLCINALHAMRETGGVLELSLSETALADDRAPELAELPPGGYLRLCVRDTGPGIPADITGRIFDPFFTTKNPGEGTGMGLAVAHGIVRRLGGAIVHENSAGQGATFSVYLPQAGTTGPDAWTGGPASARGQASILLVDDEPALLAVTREALENQGYRVTAAAGADEALRRFSLDPLGFDLLLTDQIMPGLSGTALARKILALRPGLPVVLCSAYVQAATLKEAQRLGVRKVLGKPTQLRELADTLRQILTPHPASPE